ncbi:MAG: hypothetical protein CR997_07740 [Acidobacteria bacterium]|nr:MAG: hypothetical protein CR997_07740 [Acidobacteriota bacterium]
MKKATAPQEATCGPLQRKTFQTVLKRELMEYISSLGSLTASAFVNHLEHIVEAYYPLTDRLRMGQVQKK